MIKKPEDTSILLKPRQIGYATRPNQPPSYILLLDKIDGDPKLYSTHRLFLDSTEEDLSRFQMTETFDYKVEKVITGDYKFDEVSNWIHTQTFGKWSMHCLADYQKRPQHSFLHFFFEDKEAATLFKMFQQ